ncbi:MAG: YebC/PmpR family DNA-binding transcriptional regulator [Candidatus Omnitrophica bacterium]|nr:YebC/PmpR family DNA-binding transcriptional regulator [Candidatus Omnitrophota bacterium]
MSGHSKWASIKHKKGALDAKRGKIFSKIVKEITVAARNGGGSVDQNPRLRLIVQKAKDSNMPADNIDRAIKKGTGELPGVSYEEMVYEAYGPGGTALIIESLSDNKNRTSSEVRSTLDKNGGKLANPGAVSFQFSKKGFLTVAKSKAGEEKLMDLVLEAGAQDLKSEGEVHEITTEPQDFEAVKTALNDAGIEPDSAEITMLPSNTVRVEGPDAKKVLNLIDLLEDLEDVQNVYANFDIPDDQMGD